MTRALRLLFVPTMLCATLAACGGGSGLPDCSGVCGTFIAQVSLLDVDGMPATCAATGVADIEITIAQGASVLTTHKVACGTAEVPIGPIAAGTYQLGARALAADGTALARVSQPGTIVGMNQMEPAQLRLVPGPASLLGTACDPSNACPSGYVCVGVTIASGTAQFCSKTCGTGTGMTPPANGDRVCQAGYVLSGAPKCSLYSTSMGSPDWSCAIACSADLPCPEGMRCDGAPGSTMICVR